MKEAEFGEKVSKVVNFITTVAAVATTVNAVAVQVVEHIPTYAPVVFAILAGQTSPFIRFGGLLGRLFGKK